MGDIPQILADFATLKSMFKDYRDQTVSTSS
jgi:hypothetical protein